MLRFTIRDWLWLMVVVVVGATLFVMPSPGENGQRGATRRAAEQELEANQVRYEAAKAEFRFHSTRKYSTGRGWSADQVCDVIERFAEAAEVRQDLESRVKDLAEALIFAQREASVSLDQYENGVDTAHAVYRYQYTRADMEARLRRAEQDLAVTQPTR